MFASHFQRLKDSFEKDYPGKTYERNHPAEAAYADFHRSLPVPLRLRKVRLPPASWHRVHENVASVISFDLERLGELTVEKLEDRDLPSLSELLDFLTAEFGFTWGDFTPTDEFPVYQFSDWDAHHRWYTVFLPFDVAEDTEKLYTEMWFLFRTSIWFDLSPRLTFEVNFLQVYGLQEDHIVSAEQLLQPARPDAIRFDFRDPEEAETPLTLENLQKDVATIQLIPGVPPGIREILETSKRLYVFSYFDTSFVQAAELYATLAIEAALRERYWQTVRQPVVVRAGGETRTFERCQYDSIHHLASTTPGWDLVRFASMGFLFSVHNVNC